jgi:Signal peptidase, peptidase S26
MADEKPPTPSQPIPARAVTAEPMNLPPIPLEPPPAPKAATTPRPTAPKPTEMKDTFRELIETIVFVVVLVLMLKTFLAEAFVIPTGSMADTLLGYHYKVKCDLCGKDNLVNASSEAEAPDQRNVPRIMKSRCQNCGHINVLRHPVPIQGGAP